MVFIGNINENIDKDRFLFHQETLRQAILDVNKINERILELVEKKLSKIKGNKELKTKILNDIKNNNINKIKTMIKQLKIKNNDIDGFIKFLIENLNSFN